MSREDCIASTLLSAGCIRLQAVRPALQRKERGLRRAPVAGEDSRASRRAPIRRSDRERNRFAPLGRIDDPHVDLLAFREMRYARRPKDRDMDEDVLAAVFARDKAEPLGVVKPFDLASDRDGGGRVRCDAAGSWRRIAKRALRPLYRARRVDLQHARDLSALRRRPRPVREVSPLSGPSRARRRAAHWRARNASPWPPANSTKP